MPAQPDREYRDKLAAEMGPRLDAVEAAAIFEAAQSWPLGASMPVKREMPNDLGFETGTLRADGRAVVDDVHGCPIGYLSFEEMAADGWRPD